MTQDLEHLLRLSGCLARASHLQKEPLGAKCEMAKISMWVSKCSGEGDFVVGKADVGLMPDKCIIEVWSPFVFP